MENFEIYRDIASRTGGDIYIGVVGPVRTGKSTFITKFMENLVLPNISNKLQKKIATDEMPQSGSGKTIMTTQPKFIPANSVKVNFSNKSSANVRLVDCVGYLVDGATGHLEDDKPRLVKTPWSEEEITFEKSAEIGTKKVIDEYSTIAVLVTTDGSIGEIERENYIEAEERVVNELKSQNKPFIVVLNSKNPLSEECVSLANSLEEKYSVPVISENVLSMTEKEINDVMERILMEFPMASFDISLPNWMRALPQDSEIITNLLTKIKSVSTNIQKMKDYSKIIDLFTENEDFACADLKDLKLGNGNAEYEIKAKEGLFYKVLSNRCGENLTDEYSLLNFVEEFAKNKREYDKIKVALSEAEETGYGVVSPTLEEMNLEEPTLVKKGRKYGVKLKATAPSLHIVKVDVLAEVSPYVGNEQQGEEMVNYLMKEFEDNPQGIWETNMFGKSLHDLVNESMQSKIIAMPKDTQAKMRKTLGRIVNENKGGIICILL